MQLGMFMMPFHDKARDYSTTLKEDQEAVLHADALGFSEAWIGEHFATRSETITSPLIFLASVINQTRQIKFGTGVLNLPQAHPVTTAGHAAMFDHLCEGRFIMGIGQGGLVSDIELFKTGEPARRSKMMQEAIDMVLRLWADDPPYEMHGEFWDVTLQEGIRSEFGVGSVVKPYQKPHPPIATSLVSPGSGTARVAGERGWIPVTGNFMHARYIRSHWEKYAEGCEAAGRRPDPSVWRVARSILVTESDAEAEDYMAETDTGLDYYWSFFLDNFSRRGAAFMLAPSEDMAATDVTVPLVKNTMVIAGGADTVLDRLVALVDETGPFGTLIMGGHDWDRKAMWKKSMTLLAEQVMPRLSQHSAASQAAE